MMIAQQLIRLIYTGSDTSDFERGCDSTIARCHTTEIHNQVASICSEFPIFVKSNDDKHAPSEDKETTIGVARPDFMAPALLHTMHKLITQDNTYMQNALKYRIYD